MFLILPSMRTYHLWRRRETHAHADHLTAAPYMKGQLGNHAQVCIGRRITLSQKRFAPVYGLDGNIFTRTFDVYFDDDEEFNIGNVVCRAIHLPGHTPDHLGYVMGKAIFTGDSIFNVGQLYTYEQSTSRGAD